MAPHCPLSARTSQALSFHPLFLEPSTVDHIYSHDFNLSLNPGDFQIYSPLACLAVTHLT